MMKVHTTNYYNSFIEVAADCPVKQGIIPPSKPGMHSIAQRQYDLLQKNPYRFTSDEVLFQVYAERNNISPGEMEAARQQFFSKGQPCFRTSPLTKRYGWGVHFNEEGKIAIFGCDENAYKRFSGNEKIKVLKAMSTKK
jgi:hypothetical protein